MKSILIAVACACAVLVTDVAKADVMQVDFLGVVRPMRSTAPLIIDGVQFSQGDQVRARFTYDSDVVGNNLIYQTPGLFQYSTYNFGESNPLLLSSNLSNLTTNGGTVSNFSYYTQFNQSILTIGSSTPFSVSDISNSDEGISIGYRSLGAEAWDSQIQSLTQTGSYLTGGLIAYESLSWIGANNLYQVLYADVTELIITSTPSVPVPEPASILLLGVGVFGIAAIRRRKNVGAVREIRLERSIPC